MKTRLPLLMIAVAAATVIFFAIHKQKKESIKIATVSFKEDEEQEARYTEMRARYDFDMIKNPVTGKIPANIQEAELTFARHIPEKSFVQGGLARLDDLNTYYPAGPLNQGGRTRAVAYDVRYDGTSNKVILAGGVSGGIMRSSDGGATWTRVSPDNEIHNVTCIAQDPRTGNQNTWYAGGGEPYGNSADELGAIYLGFGLYKSTDNGVTWTKLPLNTMTDYNGSPIGSGTLEGFDNPFDYVHKIEINPVNGDLYVTVHRRLVRSSDGGNTFQTVFGSAITATSLGGQMDVVISNSGKIILAVNGSNPDPTLRGVWVSTTGNLNSWTRIAGGSTLGVDSVANWRANSYINYAGSNPPVAISKRIVMGMSPSNQNVVYILYENGKSNTAPDNAPEADMFKLSMANGYTWTNLSANMPDFSGSTNNAATDPLTVQGGYDMFVGVKPDDSNFVLLGGSSLYRSTNGFANTTNTSWVGGYGNSLPNLTYYDSSHSHPDIHNVVFNPSNLKEVICGNDGGIQMSSDITANLTATVPVKWKMINNYQTLQYYNVSIDPVAGINNFMGGAQDNGVQFRDKDLFLLNGISEADSNNHIRILGGDGGHTGLSPFDQNLSQQFFYASFQLGALRRFKISASPDVNDITPIGLTTDGTAGERGEFVTNFLVDQDNAQNIYYVNYNRLFRTTSASTADSTTWTEMTGVGAKVNPGNPTAGTNIGIRALAVSRGPYLPGHSLYIGTTNGKIFRLDDPKNALASASPADITPAVGWPTGANVQDIAVNPNNDTEIMAVLSNYGVASIWWTNNAKSATPTWKNAEGNLTLPSVRSAAIVVKKDAGNNPVTEYYVGTSVGLYSAVNIGTTLTGGGSPTWQREGGSVLNFAVIQSIAYRPVDNVMVLGTHGNGLYYTFLGTPNFIPNQVTAVNNPVTNDKNFIRYVYPTLSNGPIQYRIGNMFTIKEIIIQLYNTAGQRVFHKETGYSDGSIDISSLSNGAYILSIYSDDEKYRNVQKIVKQ